MTAILSSEYVVAGKDFGAAKALDGEYFPVLGSNAINDHNSLAHTLNEASPWIQIDLATERCVKGVTIWNRINPSESNIYIYIYMVHIYIYWVYIYIYQSMSSPTSI